MCGQGLSYQPDVVANMSSEKPKSHETSDCASIRLFFFFVFFVFPFSIFWGNFINRIILAAACEIFAIHGVYW